MAAAGCRAAALALACAACTSIAVDARTFEGTRWRVTAIDGRATPADSGFWMTFGRGTAAAQFGCNRGSGSLSIRGETIVPASDWVVTTAACVSQRRMQFEHDGFEVLARTMRITWRSGGHLTLSNGAGSIELELIR